MLSEWTHGEPAGLHSTRAVPASASARFSDRPTDWRIRLSGLGGSAGICLALAAICLITWRVVQPALSEPVPLIVNDVPLAAPPQLPQDVPEGPEQVEQIESPPQEQERVEQIAIPDIPIPRNPTIAVRVQPPLPEVKPTDPVPETTAPRSVPAPPAARAASDTEASWEAMLLLHLEKFRRYPAPSRARREQGVAYVRFTMNRAGQVLSSEIQRSSGSSALDRAALDTLRRAQPLPPIPADRPETLELSVPVEFFVRTRG